MNMVTCPSMETDDPSAPASNASARSCSRRYAVAQDRIRSAPSRSACTGRGGRRGRIDIDRTALRSARPTGTDWRHLGICARAGEQRARERRESESEHGRSRARHSAGCERDSGTRAGRPRGGRIGGAGWLDGGGGHRSAPGPDWRWRRRGRAPATLGRPPAAHPPPPPRRPACDCRSHLPRRADCTGGHTAPPRTREPGRTHRVASALGRGDGRRLASPSPPPPRSADAGIDPSRNARRRRHVGVVRPAVSTTAAVNSVRAGAARLAPELGHALVPPAKLVALHARGGDVDGRIGRPRRHEHLDGAVVDAAGGAGPVGVTSAHARRPSRRPGPPHPSPIPARVTTVRGTCTRPAFSSYMRSIERVSSRLIRLARTASSANPAHARDQLLARVADVLQHVGHARVPP